MLPNRSYRSGPQAHAMRQPWTIFAATVLMLIALATSASAHAVTPGDAGYIQEIFGVHVISFIYLGAKHMITGYDHILFLLGVVFFIYHMKDVAIYVSIFAVGHSVTMILGVWYGWGINAYIIDAIIGLSVVYKALDNLGAFQKWFGFQPNTKAATLIFGLFHGTGLASKILDYQIAEDGLLGNLLSFNVGVELGQLLALFVILIVMGYWRRSPNFMRQATVANVIMVLLGLLLTYQQVMGYIGLHAHV
ncbi:HupE / UreJ protein [Roseovarius marisflavi]|uniref:HupE / UreJ protein n=2 Tax=Roseovarius marisflavi TaxID=1054996 RepID=A0A1M7DYM8_9RHOB|nr:HupE / UreJ protein [Roseovarius marisflavi]